MPDAALFLIQTFFSFEFETLKGEIGHVAVTDFL
jgi:hypothetical protein